MKRFDLFMAVVLVFVTLGTAVIASILVTTPRPIMLIHKCEGGVTIIEPQKDGSIRLIGEPLSNRKFAGVGP